MSTDYPGIRPGLQTVAGPREAEIPRRLSNQSFRILQRKIAKKFFIATFQNAALKRFGVLYQGIRFRQGELIPTGLMLTDVLTNPVTIFRSRIFHPQRKELPFRGKKEEPCRKCHTDDGFSYL